MKAFQKYYLFLSDDISEKNIWPLEVILVEYSDFERKGRNIFMDSRGNSGSPFLVNEKIHLGLKRSFTYIEIIFSIRNTD